MRKEKNMSHYHMEIVIPPVINVKEFIDSAMAEFSENNDESRHTFWDWFEIGGRYSGIKIEEILGRDRIKSFWEILKAEEITVSSFTCGKQELAPKSQEAKVNALWNEHFPNSPVKTCPLFRNYNENYADIHELGKVPESLEMYTFMIAVPNKFYENKPSAEFLLHKDFWNGRNFQKTDWDRTLKHAMELFREKTRNYKDDYREEITPKPDWLCVTIDYHN
jgi:hypothetical protein